MLIKRSFFVALLAAILTAAPACAAPQVMVTIKPLHSLAAAVMEGVGEPDLLMDGMASPHTFQLRPSTAMALHQADLVIWLGPGMESSMTGILPSLGETVRVLRLDRAEGLTLWSQRDLELWHQDSDEHEHHDHDEGLMDPHLWLDPANAIAMTNAIADALVEADPVNENTYRANAAAEVVRLEALRIELNTELAPVRDIPFITFHDAYQYYERAFGLESAGVVAISPERMPGARTVMDLRMMIMEEGIACVFSEPQFEPRLVETLTEGTATRTGILDPLGSGIPAGSGAYEALMRQLGQNTLDCLGGTGTE